MIGNMVFYSGIDIATNHYIRQQNLYPMMILLISVAMLIGLCLKEAYAMNLL